MNSNGKTGVVYVRSSGFNQHGKKVMEYTRWVMVNKRDHGAPAPEAVVPQLAQAVSASDLVVPEGLHAKNYQPALAGSDHFYGDYEIGEKISHVDGMTIEEAEHQMATRLFQNTAKVHFDQHAQKDSRFGRRLIYGGHIISLARALSFNGLGNACMMLAINGGRHVAPTFAGDTIYAWSEILDMQELNNDFGALRVRLVALKNADPNDLLLKGEDGAYDPAVVLDFDYWALIPKS
jgi:Acyl dehydratase